MTALVPSFTAQTFSYNVYQDTHIFQLPSSKPLPFVNSASSQYLDMDPTITALRSLLISESEPLARRFRALFSLKHLASLDPPGPQSEPAIHAIAAAFSSPSALLKLELAYCLGQSRHSAALSHLRAVLEDKSQDPMCRHEAAEALGALGDAGSLELLQRLRDQSEEAMVVRETCEIAVERIQWENSKAQHEENLKRRCVLETAHPP